jgi:uncharacterized repeat protein (TIGR03847 family)
VSVRIDFDPVERVTAAALGEPGARTFYLQARKDDLVVSMLLEKGQVALLASHIDDLLERVGAPEEGTGPDPDVLDLEEPITPDFRIGRIGLGYDGDRDLVLLQCDEFEPVDEEEEGEPLEIDPPERDDLGRVRMWATREQMYALARRGEREVAGGRPTCSMCGQPIEPEGHFCPRSNGHREVTRLA